MSQNEIPFSVTSNVISFFVANKMYNRSDLNGYLLVYNKTKEFKHYFLQLLVKTYSFLWLYFGKKLL